jgi:hypothetical protein
MLVLCVIVKKMGSSEELWANSGVRTLRYGPLEYNAICVLAQV